MRKLTQWSIVLLLSLLCATAVHGGTPKSMMFELRFGPTSPGVDTAFESATPYEDAFGSELVWNLGGYWDYQLLRDYGTLAIGAGISYGWVTGQASESDSSDETELNILPLTLGLTYRLDMAATQWGVPVVPYGKAGITCAIWWVTNGKGEVANTRNPVSPFEERTGWSNTFGFYYGGGVQILLDIFSDRMSATMDNEMGINNSYLFFEYLVHTLNDFGSGQSIELSSEAFSFGLMFEF